VNRSTDLDWERLLASHGVKAAFGNRFFVSGIEESYVRLSIASLDDEQIVEGVQRLSAALREGQRPAARRR
jgi:DNA-binding transcriptional MocR family regulator